MKEIIMDISNDGEIHIETKGFKGKSCLKEAEFIENTLGKRISQQLTPAYFETEGCRDNTKRHLPLCG